MRQRKITRYVKRLSSPKENSPEQSLQMQTSEMDLLHETGKNKTKQDETQKVFYLLFTKIFEKHCMSQHGTI